PREPVRALDILTRLRLKGVQLSIDDFGTGYSSFGQLHHLPFSELKIDLGFVRVADRDPVARAIVENSIRLGRQLGLTVVAEGVESATLWHWLREQGCDLAQGYLVSRPMPADQLPAWYAAWGAPACPA
ncbi:MAG TPA: EAL domain-containing protein, partial [Plasticicumulans sp.]|nr:EAL domain-containing protein [Plasticicumulans sp.]